MRGRRPVVMAAVAGAHGVAGEVRLKLFTGSVDNLKAHARFEAGGRTLTLKSVRPGPQGAVARFAEVGDRTAAEGLRGTVLTVPRDSLPALPAGEYYWHDLLGLFDGKSPRHAKRFAEIGQAMREAVSAYVSEVEAGAFPTDAQSSRKMEDGALDEALGSIYGAGGR